MTSQIPLFPLSIVSYPAEQVNLHIFEPRYKQLITECWEENKTFGIVAFIDNKLMDYGTEMKVIEIAKKYNKGEMDIKSVGVRAFKLEKFYETLNDKLYAGGDVTFIEDDGEKDVVLELEIIEKLKQLFSYLNIKKEIKEVSTYDIAHYLGMKLKEEYKFLKIDNEKDRQTFIVNYLDRMLPVALRAKRIREQVKMNGHFKNFPQLDI